MYLVASNVKNRDANSMFRREQLHGGGLDKCAAYLQRIFGDSLNGARVIDYGCGRGNWALAFLRAGARQVLAIDAADDNVQRLRDYCSSHGIDGIDVVHGDLLRQNITAEKADIVWLYGVMHHVGRPLALLQSLRDMAPGKAAQFYVYGNDAGSLRHFTVDTARQLYPHPNEEAFRVESMPLTRDTRRRARDDLTVAHLDWYGATEFAELLSGAGLEPIAQAEGFEVFQNGRRNQEFQPHEALCRGVPAEGAILWSEPERGYGDDLCVLSAMAREVNFAVTDESARIQVALGLMNTHFSHLSSDMSGAKATLEIFLYLLHALDVHGELEQTEGLAADFVALADAALSDAPRKHLAAASHPSNLARYLCENMIRL